MNGFLFEFGEEALPILLTVGVLVFRLISGIAKKSQGKNMQDSSASEPSQAPAPKPASEMVESIFAKFSQMTQAPSPEFAWEDVHDFESGEGIEGSSAYDDAGCVGGSIEHDDHEGSARNATMQPTQYEALHASMHGSLEYIPITHYTPVAFGGTAADAPQTIKHTPLTSAQLRTAIIMAEALGKPVALRKRAGTLRTGHTA